MVPVMFVIFFRIPPLYAPLFHYSRPNSMAAYDFSLPLPCVVCGLDEASHCRSAFPELKDFRSNAGWTSTEQ